MRELEMEIARGRKTMTSKFLEAMILGDKLPSADRARLAVHFVVGLLADIPIGEDFPSYKEYQGKVGFTDGDRRELEEAFARPFEGISDQLRELQETVSGLGQRLASVEMDLRVAEGVSSPGGETVNE